LYICKGERVLLSRGSVVCLGSLGLAHLQQSAQCVLSSGHLRIPPLQFARSRGLSSVVFPGTPSSLFLFLTFQIPILLQKEQTAITSHIRSHLSRLQRNLRPSRAFKPLRLVYRCVRIVRAHIRSQNRPRPTLRIVQAFFSRRPLPHYPHPGQLTSWETFLHLQITRHKHNHHG
jgi:hypothetical protein